jgi:hypothetical protein
MRVIVIQEALSGLSLKEAQFVLRTVHENMELNEELRSIAGGREE